MQLEIKNGWMEESMCRERKERRTGGVEGGGREYKLYLVRASHE